MKKFLNAIAAVMAASVLMIMLVSCGGAAMEYEKNTDGYYMISQPEAMKIMKEKPGYIIVDVRTQSEYDSGHIKGAICIPNETIGSGEIELLPDKNATILVYCRSGRRSKEAAAKLAAGGYTNVYEFGGIITWSGDVE